MNENKEANQYTRTSAGTDSDRQELTVNAPIKSWADMLEDDPHEASVLQRKKARKKVRKRMRRKMEQTKRQ